MAEADGAALLRLDGVSRVYDDGFPVHALRPTTLDIARGAYVTITGPSGSGKSTLLNLLGLLDTPTAGSYRVDGVELCGAAEVLRNAVRGQMFGFVFQAFHLLPGRTALENVEIGMLYGPHGRRARRALATEAMERIGLTHRLHADPRTLSGGERQRVAIARAIAARPRVLFCDEPTGNLDSANTANVLELLRELSRAGLTVVVVTHEPEVAAAGEQRLRVVDGVVGPA
ncbi:ABC transporter ATP-binding protein [Thermomonospora cellulosilytica]|uniref:Putative ABC transport system ATP-binding protein n=1 Tax=Thermomonospora cellulosilytica TaxID=1411118 RepID=A0A7W3N477_9ACTN|nr:ATP-binding cassette domain-containing protein [Thermomonospora cellulosilytica]MBA9007147.1 putative ABC transport system ATP-binding protein [Thermomonospora cellulosilytica]